MRGPLADRHHHHWLLIAGMAWLLILFVIGVLAATRSVADDVPVRLRAGSGATLSRDGSALLLPGGGSSEATAELHFSLPPPDPAMSRWVVWLEREPVDALWLETPGWRSEQRDFFRAGSDEGVLPGGFILALPATWQGPIVLAMHVRGSGPLALHPKVLRETVAMQFAHRSVALESMIYAALFMLALLGLALYSAARDRSFLAMFGSSSAALLLLAAQNGHLYLLPGFAWLAIWRGSGLWSLGLLFNAAALQMLLRYAEMRRDSIRARRWFEGCCVALVGLAAVCLLDLRMLDPALQGLVALGWLVTAGCAVIVLAPAFRHRMPMASSILLMVLVTLVASLLRMALSRGYLVDMLWTRFGYQFALVVTAAVLMVGLISRIDDFRLQRDRDRLARVDTERRMAREAARADLTLMLQTRLRAPAAADIEWLAFHLLLERLRPQIPVAWGAVVAFGYHGHDLLVVEPTEDKQQVQASIAPRSLALKRLALQGAPLQQAIGASGEPCIEALLPLPIRAPGCGMLLLHRAGNDGFSTEEMLLAGDFARLATLHADESLAAMRLRQSAEIDALTGTFNRRSMDQWLVRAFLEAHRQQQPLSLLFIDIDHFKAVNDRLGHAAGDHCLRQVAQAVRDVLEPGDMLGRYGGEEFVAMLPGRSAAEARETGERLRAAVERRDIPFEGHAQHLTVSVGVATRLEGESAPAATVERADKALYAAKHAGRNCVHVAPAVFA